jgi:hypothetical protein
MLTSQIPLAVKPTRPSGAAFLPEAPAIVNSASIISESIPNHPCKKLRQNNLRGSGEPKVTFFFEAGSDGRL